MSTTEATTGAVTLAYKSISEAIRRGVYPANSRLPSERELSVTTGVSRSTLRQALTALAEEGLLKSSSQRGWFVASRMLSEPPSVLQSFTEMAEARGLTPSTKVLDKRVRSATFDEASKLGIAPTSAVLELRRLRSFDRIPVCFDINILARGVEELSAIDFTDRSLYRSLQDACGIRVARCSYSVQAVAASAEIASLLSIKEGEPVLAGRETTFGDNGVPLSLGSTFYRGDAYRFEADLYRPLQ
ncbi:MAG: GntR family transcriptional regulator [Cryobacterium sp.]|nr:GntR family transcriptional regulator [Cryobacterium sp.]